jgi:hypothetical protein
VHERPSTLCVLAIRSGTEFHPGGTVEKVDKWNIVIDGRSLE